jgi:hypothetical protein
MNHVSTTPHKPLIKSWFGFSVGAIFVGMNLLELSGNLTLAGILSTLGFLCFWYPWSQMTHWNKPITIKSFFKTDNQAISKSSTYLIVIATILLITSTLIRLIN